MTRAHLAAVLLVLVLVALSLVAVAQPTSRARAEVTAPRAEVTALQPVGSAFTYQGQLTDDAGNPLTGTYDFQFHLFAEASGGDPLAAAARDDLEIVGGLFTLPLDFGPDLFKGEARYLEISVRAGAGASTFTTLTPRQPLTAAPYAMALPGLYTRPNAQSPNVIGGHPENVVAASVVGVVVGGGGAESAGHYVSASFGTIGGGANNTATGEYATVGGGYRNLARGDNATASGGWDNASSGYGDFVGGGSNNRADGDRTTIVGGYGNAASGDLASVGGGDHNRATAKRATIAGGSHVEVTGEAAAVGGGEYITVTGQWAGVGGGIRNHVAPPASGMWGSVAGTIGGGEGNLVGNAHATVGGGGNNRATGYGSVVAGGGGYEHYGSLLPEWPSAGSTAGGTWSTVAGGGRNTAGAYASTVGGGFGNEAVGEFSTVGGGGPEPSEVENPAGPNRATDAYTTIGGGAGNHAGGLETFPMDASFATVGGGRHNRATWRAATVAGGEGNTAGAMHATVPGGLGNHATAPQTFAAGTSARADHAGAFVWADADTQTFASTANNEFAARATGGVRLVLAVDAGGNPTWVCSVVAGGSWACSSDRDLKTNLAPADGREVLERLDGMRIYAWSPKGDEDARHMGPMAQDFQAAFGLGQDDISISTIDLDGVALAAIQGLHDIVREQEDRIEGLEQDLARLETRIAAIESASEPVPARAPWSAGAGILVGGLVLGLAALGRGSGGIGVHAGER